MTAKYTMTLNMRVLEHLGIRLYSNVAAVLSELVANSWDAEATKVTILFEGDERITISDDGNGMTAQQLNDRFLMAGYEKRRVEGDSSKRFGRGFMGRKGIGKLSVLSMAKNVAIYSSCDGEHSSLRIIAADLEKAIEAGLPYHPQEIPFEDSVAKVGTTIVLTDLVKKRANITVAALRKRLARRFSIIGHHGKQSGDQFNVIINGKPVDYTDRDDVRALEYVWEFGKEVLPKASMPHLAERFVVADNHIPGHASWRVDGWFGTARKPTDLDDDADVGSMQNIVVIARGRLIQESILDKLGFNRIFASYATGLIQADFLDTLDSDDIATSDRQRLIEDDPRVIALRAFMRQKLLDASETWVDHRRAKKADDASSEHPALKTWFEELPDGQRPAARSMIGLIGGIQLDPKNEADRSQLYRSGVLAFERLRLNEVAHNLERLTDLDANKLLPLLVLQDHFESALYADIVRTRLQAIKQFQSLTDAKAKEAVLQQHLFDNLWILDAGWERVEGSQTIEHRLVRDFPKEFADDLTANEKRGRVDIKYRNSAGMHIIVELKKYERKMTLTELQEQGKKYYAAMHKLATQDGEKNPRIEVVFVLGQPIVDEYGAGQEPGYMDKQLRVVHQRVTYYDELITKATASYSDFLKANDKADRIGRILKGIEDGTAPPPVPARTQAQPALKRQAANLPKRSIPAKKKPGKKKR